MQDIAEATDERDLFALRFTSFARPTILRRGAVLMAEFAANAGSGLLDLSATSLVDLPQLDDEMLEIILDRFIQPCGDGTNDTPPATGRARIWQNYRTV